MIKFPFAAAIAIAMTVTASAHIWNRPVGSGLRIDPCRVSYHFQRGFCAKTSLSKKAWFARAIENIL